MKWILACLLALFMVTPAIAGDPYLAIVGKDVEANSFYLSPKYDQFLYEGEECDEAFTTNAPLIQPEVCDLAGKATMIRGKPYPPFTFSGNFNGRITKGSAGLFEWKISLPMNPSGEINICIQCGVLVPNSFAFFVFDSVKKSASETGVLSGVNTSDPVAVGPGQNTIRAAALPTIITTASPGVGNPNFTPFNLTAFRNPGTYEPVIAAGDSYQITNSPSTQVLDGTTGARILLKSCMDKCIVVKLPVTGQINVLGQVEHDLVAGDVIKVRMNIPRENTVDIYCHKESVKMMGIGGKINY